MPKRLNDIQKEEITKRFLNGETLDFIANTYGYTKLTIYRHIKKSIGTESFNNLNKNIKSTGKKKVREEEIKIQNCSEEIKQDNENFPANSIAPNLNENNSIENSKRKDLTSIPISEIDFPEIVYMVVDKKIELETKQLKDYPEWDFLPEEDLKIKTIEIYLDLKMAKRDCKKDQKVIKVPNPNVFKIASKIMISRGIARIICDKQLISL